MDGVVIYLNGTRGLSVVDAIHAAGHGIARVVVPASKQAELARAPLFARLGQTPIGADDVNAPTFIAALAAARPKLGVIAGYSTIFRAPLIDLPALGTINLHAGRLPAYRGGSPLNWQIINGEAEAGVSVIRVDAGIDTGPVLAEARLPIGADETIAALHERANEVFPRLVLEVIAGLEKGTLKGRTQDEGEACYWHQRNDADGYLDWARLSAKAAHAMVRALTRPYPGAFGLLDGAKVRLYRSSLDVPMIRGAPGRIAYIGGRGPYVMCADRAIRIDELDIEGRPGARLPHGARLA